MTKDQLPKEDTLVDRGLEDALDEGYSPPDRPPPTYRDASEHESLDDRLTQEEPEPSAQAPGADENRTWPEGTTADPRAGRLVAPDEGAHGDDEKDEVARDAGIAGGAASAEEAAMHIQDEGA